jgi:hypothetical protein
VADEELAEEFTIERQVRVASRHGARVQGVRFPETPLRHS